MRWKHNQTVDPPLPSPPKYRAPGWQGTVWCPSTNSSLQISIFRIHQIFNISYFPQFNQSSQKKYLFPKMLRNHPKIYKKPPKSGIEIQRCLKRDRDNDVDPALNHQVLIHRLLLYCTSCMFLWKCRVIPKIILVFLTR